MDPDAIALFRELADRSPAAREEYYARHRVPAALRAEVESLLHFDREAVDSLPDYVAAAAHRVLLDQAGPTTAHDQSLTSGTRLGPYEIVAPVGAGGMGEVYKARDTRLDRTVAIKVLPPHVASDPDLKQRFEREARMLAALSHPHICPVFDVGHHEDTDFLVMEYLKGETLADRLSKGPVPFDQGLRYAIQIAAALAKAHSVGIVHRDLKPGNIMLTSSGATLLDFGLAKPMRLAPGRNRSESPTKPPITERGAILGTVQYMAPEQLEGREADARTDIFAFGAVVYEMLSGKKAFVGKSDVSVIAAIMQADPPPIAASQPLTPPLLDHLVKKCLAKDPDERWQSAKDLCEELTWMADTPSEKGAPVSARAPRVFSRRAAGIAAAVLGAVAAAIVVWSLRAGTPVVNSFRFEMQPPEGHAFGNVAVPSPDGRYLTLQAVDVTGRPLLWIHSFETGVTRSVAMIPVSAPWWSPDGRYVAFYWEGKLRKVGVNGSPPQTICDLPVGTSQGSWNGDDVILFGLNPGPLMRVAAAGGAPAPVTALDTVRQEIRHTGPRFLPDGRHFVYARLSRVPENSGIFIGSLDAKPEEQELRMLVPSSLSPGYAPSSDPGVGYLLYIREGTLFARAIDNVSLQLTGDVIPVAEQVADNGVSTGMFAASGAMLTYQKVGRSEAGLVWVNRGGHETGTATPGVLRQPEFPRLSPDGRRVALTISRDVWVYDLEGRPPIKLTADARNSSPLWTLDGTRLVYEVNDSATLRSISADGVGRESEPLPISGHFHPYGWSTDGRWLVAARLDSFGGPNDIVRLPVDRHGEAEPIAQEVGLDGLVGRALAASVSSNGQWVAYVSNETGEPAVWVQPLSGPRAPIRISPNGGTEPIWSKDGRELFYLQGRKMMAVAVETANGFSFKPPTFLLDSQYLQTTQAPSFDVSKNGQFLMIKPSGTVAANAPLTIVLNWQEGLNRQRDFH